MVQVVRSFSCALSLPHLMDLVQRRVLDIIMHCEHGFEPSPSDGEGREHVKSRKRLISGTYFGKEVMFTEIISFKVSHQNGAFIKLNNFEDKVTMDKGWGWVLLHCKGKEAR